MRNRQGLVEDHGRDRYPVFEVRESDTLAKAIGKIRATHSHRVKDLVFFLMLYN